MTPIPLWAKRVLTIIVAPFLLMAHAFCGACIAVADEGREDVADLWEGNW